MKPGSNNSLYLFNDAGRYDIQFLYVTSTTYKLNHGEIILYSNIISIEIN